VLNLLYVREYILGDLISVTKGLNSLEREWMYTPELEDDKFQTPIIDLKRINKALYRVRETLTNLTIWAQCLYGYPRDWPMWDDYPQLSTRGTMRVMTKLDKLTELTIPITFLLGFTPLLGRRIEDVLPPNIEDLTMTDDLCLFWQYDWKHCDIVDVLAPWLEKCRTMTPHIRCLTLLLKTEYDGWNRPIREELEELCIKAGVDLAILKRYGG
jgi:hypothetical protein